MSALLSLLKPSGARLDLFGGLLVCAGIGLFLAGVEIPVIVALLTALVGVVVRGGAIAIEQKAKAKEPTTTNSVPEGSVLFGVRVGSQPQSGDA